MEFLATLDVRLGPITATIDRLGFAAAGGARDREPPTFGYRGPSGIGLLIDSEPVVGGGYLFADRAAGLYAGTLQLEIKGLTLQAVGVITTKMPDGTPGFSLLVIITGDFPAVNLGFGFRLTGAGGLLAYNRTANVEALRAGLKNKSLDAVLFPENPVADAPRIVGTLQTVMPPRDGQYMAGPVAQIVWGVPTILTLELAVVLEAPSPWRLLILGQIRALLPHTDRVLVRLQMDVLGVVDWDRDEIAIDAVLYDSFVLTHALTGDMALRARWGRDPSFLLAVGGFNPNFAPPAAFPTLARAAMTVSRGDSTRLRLEAYFALTSNTAQVGARLELLVRASGFSVEGHLGFDALFEFSPFHFVVDIKAGVTLKWHGRTLLGVDLELTLSGPSPWHAHGKATFKIWRFSKSISFDRTFGADEPPPPLPPADPLPELLQALGDAAQLERAAAAGDCVPADVPRAARDDGRAGPSGGRPERATARGAARHHAGAVRQHHARRRPALHARRERGRRAAAGHRRARARLLRGGTVPGAQRLEQAAAAVVRADGSRRANRRVDDHRRRAGCVARGRCRHRVRDDRGRPRGRGARRAAAGRDARGPPPACLAGRAPACHPCHGPSAIRRSRARARRRPHPLSGRQHPRPVAGRPSGFARKRALVHGRRSGVAGTRAAEPVARRLAASGRGDCSRGGETVSARYRFVPWVRRGAAASIRTVDTLGANLPARADLPLRVRVNARADVGVSLRLHGPGDVIGFDGRVVVRTDPGHMATNFEPNYFPSIELDGPDLPWLLTPATGDRQGRLRPWLCLVVVRKQAGVTLTADRVRPLPVLAIRPPARPARELPDLAESWAWAHTQVVSTDEASLADLLSDPDVPAVSRLVCPRRLLADASYYACLVPAFEVGRRAGLGEAFAPEEQAQLTPAWNLGANPASIELPVYFHWEFSTGRGGDFESLARRLRGQPVPEGVGERALIVGDAGFGLPDAGVLPLEGALRVPNGGTRVAVPAEFQATLQALLNLPDALQRGADSDPIVAPPIYGSWQAAQLRLDDASPRWVRDGNLDPRYRAAAGLGALVVQDQQEQLMASAWEQLGAIGHERQRLRQQELGRSVLARVHKGLTGLVPERFFEVTAPLHARVRIDRPVVVSSGESPPSAPATAREHIRLSAVPLAVTSATFHRVTRPSGPIVRRTLREDGAAPRVLAFTPRFEETVQPLRGVALTRSIGSTVTAAAIEARLQQLVVLSTMLGVASQFNAAVREVSGYLATAVGEPRPTPPRPGLVLDRLKAAMLQQIDPALTFRASTDTRGTRADRAEGRTTGDRLELLPGPSFPQPMYEAMREFAPDLLLPGVEAIPTDSITLVETNPPVIGAYMLGLNHEMSRELQWREYPSDLRGTSFRRFWAGPTEMPEIHEWSAESPLGAHVAAGSGERQLVLLVRGELLQRYPQTAIYAVPAIDRRTPGVGRRYPIFRAALGPDLACFGFDLGIDEVRGESDAGWFFVIEQPHGQVRFGLDEATTTGRDPAQLTSWNDVSWGDMAASSELLDLLTHAPVAGPLVGRRIGKTEWGLNGGHMAGATLQRPVRVLQHAADLLPSTDDQ
jgi:hypothetical protein